MCFKLFTGLAAMSFLWVGSQIPLYLFGALLPDIYTDIGGAERYQWMVIGYLIPNASLCPFVGALSDMFGRRWVAAGGQVLLIVGPIVTATANTMNVAIGRPCLTENGFLPSGHLLISCGRRASHFWIGGRSERIDRLSWNG